MHIDAKKHQASFEFGDLMFFEFWENRSRPVNQNIEYELED